MTIRNEMHFTNIISAVNNYSILWRYLSIALNDEWDSVGGLNLSVYERYSKLDRYFSLSTFFRRPVIYSVKIYNRLRNVVSYWTVLYSILNTSI